MYQSTRQYAGASSSRRAAPTPPPPPLASVSGTQPSLPDTRTGDRPFMVQCRDVKIGRAGAKAVYLIAASFCDQFSRSEKARALLDEHGEAVCWPSLDTLRNAAEMGRSKFLMEWRYLRDGGFVGTMYGNGTKVIRTPAAALRARAAGIAPRPRPTKGVGRQHLQRCWTRNT